MSKIKVEKFTAEVLEGSVSVPAFFVNIAVHIFPESAISKLANRGIDIRAILDAQKRSGTYSSSIDVEEGSVQKTVVISVA